WGRRVASGLGRAAKHLSIETAADLRRSHRLQIRVARDARLERFQPACCVQEKWRGLSDTHQIQGDLSPQALRECALALVELPFERSGNERRRGVRGSGQLL